MAYSWKPEEVLHLLGIPVHPGKTEIYISCPSCGSKRFSLNTVKGIGKCWKCNFSADSASYYATCTGLSLNDARKEIESKLGIERNGERSIPPRIVYNTQHTEAEKASGDVLDLTYRAFLAELGLADKNKLSLHSRGFDSDDDIAALNYKTFPRMDEIDYYALCRRLQMAGYSLKGVPGFYKTNKGDYTFVQITKGIIMPQVNYRNQITGLQIRKDDDLLAYNDDLGEYEKKCSWFSSKNRDGGCPANAHVHYACDWKYNPEKEMYEPVCEKKAFALTEGIMKGDLFHYFMPNVPVIAVPGVHALNNLRKELIRLRDDFDVKTILLAYDMDYQTNPNVQEAMDKTRKIIEEVGLELKQYNWEQKIVVNNEVVGYANGIDDFLAYKLKGIVPTIKKK